MKLPTSLAIAIALLLLGTPAAPRNVVLDCADLRLPDQRDVARGMDTQNFARVYEARTRLMINAQRACARGAEQVMLVLEPNDARSADAIDQRVVAADQD